MNIPGWAIERTYTGTPYMAGRRWCGGAHLLVRIAGYGVTMVIADTPDHAVMAHGAGSAGVLIWRECAGVPDDHVICAEVTMLVDEFERVLDTIKLTPPSLADLIRNLPMPAIDVWQKLRIEQSMHGRMYPLVSSQYGQGFPSRPRGNPVNGQPVRTYADPIQGLDYNSVYIDSNKEG